MDAVRVLLATDGSEPTIRAAELLVRMASGPIVARVFTTLSYTAYPFPMVPGTERPVEDPGLTEVEDAVDAATRDARLILEKAGIPVSVGHRFGNPADEILAEMDAFQPDLVLLGRRGVRGLERLLGSVSEHVLRRAHVPVLLVP